MEKSIISLEDSLDSVFGLSSKDWKLYSPLTLAYLGDAVYEMVIRTICVKRTNMQTQKLHRKVTGYVSAKAQAKMMDALIGELTEEEESIYRRGRNSKPYTKAKNAEEHLTQQIAQGEQELEYLDSVLEAITEAENLTDLAQIHEELVKTGYLSAKQDKKKRRNAKPVQGKPFHYRTSDGFDVFAGKNNIQNDLLTLKTAFKRDMWFHTQKIHGSHVILFVTGGSRRMRR